MRPRHLQLPGQRCRGFTLLEVLVATSAYAIILSGVYAVFARAIRLRRDAQLRLEERQLVHRAGTILRHDLAGAFVSNGILQTRLVGEKEGPTSQYPGYLCFTTTSGRLLEDEPGVADIQEVAYFVEPRTEETEEPGGILVRTVNPTLLAQVQTTPPGEWVLEGVESLELSFLDASGWVDAWDTTTASNAVPIAVSVRINLAAREGQRRASAPIELFVPWSVQPLPTTETAGSEGDSEPNPSQNPPEGAGGRP